MEAVVVNLVDTKTWKTVDLQGVYQKPVIACSVKYHSTLMVPVVVRMSGVTRQSFRVALQNPSGLGSSVGRQVHCLVVEEGVWKLPDGRKVEARRVMSTRTDHSASWIGTSQSYRHVYSTDPVVLGQVMSYNDTKWSTFWTCGKSHWKAPDITNLAVGLHVGEDPVRDRRSEEIGYIVMEPGRAAVLAVSSTAFVVESGRSAVQPMGYVDGNWTSPLRGTFAQPPAATIVTQAGMFGLNGGWAILTANATSTQFGLAIDEDQTFDAERKHGQEDVSYVAVSSLAPVRLVQS
jgi:hypothetical protein